MPEFLRVLPTTGILNLRDHGGYAVVGGGRVRTGLLYRSGQHLHATPEDLDIVAGLDLSAMIDLRGLKERARSPCPRPARFSAEMIIATGETTGTGRAPHVQAAQQQHMRSAGEIREVFRGIYARMIDGDPLMDLFRRYFERLAIADGPTLLHCHAGKDRTGLLAALLHRLLGVHPDDIMADYLLTNTASQIEGRPLTEEQRRNFPVLDDEAARTVLSVEPSYLETAFAAIDAKYGNIDRFMVERLGVDHARADAIRTKLVQ